MDKVKDLPYGISDFRRIIRDNYYYVDKSMYIALAEDTSSYLFMIRPRRFGKSLFLSMLEEYYDVAEKDNFEKYFGNLWIGSHPTPRRNCYQVLYFDFSKASAGRGTLEENFNDYCCIWLDAFMRKYADYYAEDVRTAFFKCTSAADKLGKIESESKQKQIPLYLIIDEYDNFTNVILSEHGKEKFRELTHASGFYRDYFKIFKGMFDRIFMMGVSPVTLDDVSSGYNIDWNISTDPRFNNMMGFSETDVRTMLLYYKEKGKLQGDPEAMLEEMRPWYDNYCFAVESLNDDRVFNCDMTLYYLRHQIQLHRPPKEMVDKNIRTDYSKLKMFAVMDKEGRHIGHRIGIIEEIAAKGEITIELHTSFPAESVVQEDNFGSLLYYYGLLTMCANRGTRIKMCIPNNCVKEQYYGFLLNYYQQNHSINLSTLADKMDDMVWEGKWRPYFDMIAKAFYDNSSVRDSIKGEQNLQGFFKAYLSLAGYYLLEPELEMNYGYCDFFLLPDRQRYPDVKHSYIIELKYLPRTASEKEQEQQRKDGIAQLKQYSRDKIARHLAGNTIVHQILLQFKAWELIYAEETNELS